MTGTGVDVTITGSGDSPDILDIRKSLHADISQALAAAAAGAGSRAAMSADETADRIRLLFLDTCETGLLLLATDEAEHGSSDGAEVEVRHLVDSVLRPLATVLAQLPAGVGVPRDVSQMGPATPALVDERLWRLAIDATRLCVLPGVPAEVLEATAMLQRIVFRRTATEDSAQDTAEASLIDARIAELRAIQVDIGPTIQAMTDGPYLVTNVADLRNWMGERIITPPQVALCRCGASATKPFCDGSHAKIGFSGAKQDSRTPDRRDRYRGVQVTILDNRGTCAHSAFCTDRLSGVFHLGAEPFVTPNGARMDDIVRAVRSCPSGALSFAVGGQEALDQVNPDRPPVIEVSKNGPYRVTGGITLLDGAGQDEVRNDGASREHYSLCRCGQSTNKPFCSGMHWSVNFTDPAESEDPTLYEWAGGMPTLLRMTTVFYTKYVPQDPLLRPLFGSMSPDHPQRVAAWLSEVFGGPSVYTDTYGGYSRMISEHLGKKLSEAQRKRWTELIVLAADEIGLPDDAEFRAAFIAYVEWGSRIARENSQLNAKPPAGLRVPRWHWVCDATPGARVSALTPVDDTEVEETFEVPHPDEQLSFARHIKGMFRTRDRQSMKFVFDLWAYEDVKQHGNAILTRLRQGSMPCDGAWAPEKVDVFERWLTSGADA